MGRKNRKRSTKSATNAKNKKKQENSTTPKRKSTGEQISRIFLGKKPFSNEFIFYNLGLSLDSRTSAQGEKVKLQETSVSEGKKLYKLTKNALVSAYNALRRLGNNCHPLFKKFKLPLCKKKFAHEKYRDVLAPALAQILSKITGKNFNDENDAFKLWDDAYLISTQMHDVDAKTTNLLGKQIYEIQKSAQLDQKALQSIEQFKQTGGVRQINKNAFDKFKFSFPVQNLMNQKRTKCKKCKKRAHVYCPFCSCLVCEDTGFPNIDLPVFVDLVRHPRETVKKSSGLHSKIVSPNCVRHFTWPDEVPEYDPESTFILYPNETAQYLDEMDLSKVERVIVIENTWRGVSRILEHDNLKNLPTVKIRNEVSLYWRHQDVGNDCLATIEAIYYFFVQWWKASKEIKYNGEFDNLLLLYAHDFQRTWNNPLSNPKSWALSGIETNNPHPKCIADLVSVREAKEKAIATEKEEN